MIKALAVSKTAKALGLCVCPVVGAGVVATQVPSVRTAIHKATAPRAYAKPKTRVRAPGAAPVKLASIDPCVTNNPVIIQSGQAFNLPTLPETGPILAMNDPLTPSTISRVTPPLVYGPGPQVIPINPPGGPGGPGDPGTPGNPNPPIPPVNAVPEPATWAQLVFGFVIIGGVMRSASRSRTTFDEPAEDAA